MVIKATIRPATEKELVEARKILEKKKPVEKPKVVKKLPEIKKLPDKINEKVMNAQSLVNELTPMIKDGRMITATELNAIKSKYNLK